MDELRWTNTIINISTYFTYQREKTISYSLSSLSAWNMITHYHQISQNNFDIPKRKGVLLLSINRLKTRKSRNELSALGFFDILENQTNDFFKNNFLSHQHHHNHLQQRQSNIDCNSDQEAISMWPTFSLTSILPSIPTAIVQHLFSPPG